MFGATVAQLDEDEFQCMVEQTQWVLDLKRILADRVGCSRFRLRLFGHGIGELLDDMSLRPLPSVQLVILDFCADETMEKKLLQYCEENRVDEVAQLLQRPQDPRNVRATDANANYAPIHVAADVGSLELVQLLLEAGADKHVATAATEEGAWALSNAAQNGHLEVARLLLNAGAAPDAARVREGTALYFACQNGHLDVARMLLEAGADKDTALDNGATALIIAAEKGHFEVVRLLLNAGADKNAAQKSGATALYAAAVKATCELCSSCWRLGLTKMLQRKIGQHLCLL